MDGDEIDLDEFVENFRKHLSEVDELAQVILKGHLEVERHLDDVVDTIFFRPEYLRDARLNFHQKIRIAKAYSPDPTARDWQVIEGLNKARNSIAHRAGVEKRAAEIAKLREALSKWGTERSRLSNKSADEIEVVVLAAAMCSGFLLYLEDSVRKVRDAIGKSLSVPTLLDAEE